MKFWRVPSNSQNPPSFIWKIYVKSGKSPKKVCKKSVWIQPWLEKHLVQRKEDLTLSNHCYRTFRPHRGAHSEGDLHHLDPGDAGHSLGRSISLERSGCFNHTPVRPRDLASSLSWLQVLLIKELKDATIIIYIGPIRSNCCRHQLSTTPRPDRSQ